MEAEIRIGGPGAADQYPLMWDWLAGEPRLRGQVRWASGPPGDTALGADSWIAIVLGAGGAGTVLVNSIGKWLSRPARPGLKVKITARKSGSQETRTVELEIGRVNEKTHRILTELLNSTEGTAIESATEDLERGR